MNKQNLLEKNEKNLTKAMNLFIGSSFIAQCSLAGLIHGAMKRSEQIKKVASVCGVQERTILRWFNGEPSHPCAQRLLFNLYMGFPQHSRWRGWSLCDEHIKSPNGEIFTRDTLANLWIVNNDLKYLRIEKARLSKENDSLRSFVSSDSLRARSRT